ncbi:MAG: helix-turn-helix domain-containing protein [Dialister invisus]|uniref:helix-turn-helix domain-containing protein n=1 Tax=Dialister invisus TaxID=218538 RepID=UPI003999CA2A
MITICRTGGYSLKLCFKREGYIREGGVFILKANYKKLWHILLDRNMKKKELAELAGVSTYTINKLNKNDNVTVEVLGKICKALNCTLDDIMESREDGK